MATQYEEDFHAWTQDQAAKLRLLRAERSNFDLDFDNLAEEIESVGISDRREVLSRMTTIAEHLAKLALSSADNPRTGWARTVRIQRRDLERLLAQSPSLRSFARDSFRECYRDGVEDARASHPDMAKLGGGDDTLFTFDQMLDRDWMLSSDRPNDG